MAWTANLDSFERSSSGLGVVAHVTFTDGTLATTEAITVDCMTAQSLANIVADRLAGYQSREDAMATLAVGPITPGIKSSEQQLRDTLATARDLLKQGQVNTPFVAKIDDVLTTTAPTPVLAMATSPAAKVAA
jgi:hypothetical protein